MPNNHTFDWGYGGLISMLDALEKTDFVHTGVGMNLDEAMNITHFYKAYPKKA